MAVQPERIWSEVTAKRMISVGPPADPVYDDAFLEQVLSALRTEFPEFDFEVDHAIKASPAAYLMKVGNGPVTRAEASRLSEIGAFLHDRWKLSITRH